MWVYIVNLISFPVYALFFNSCWIKDKRKAVVAVASTQMFLILALRADNLGVDLGNYERAFYYISELSFPDLLSKLRFIKTAVLQPPHKLESGYVVLNWFIAALGGRFHTLLVVSALVVSIPYARLVYYKSEIPWLSFFIYCACTCFEFDFGILRQALAVAISIEAYLCVHKKKNARAFFWVLLAFTFHRTALVMLPILLIPKIKLKKTMLYSIYAVLVLIVVIFGREILNYVILISNKYHLSLGIYQVYDFQVNNLFLVLTIVIAGSILLGKNKIKENKYKIDFYMVFILYLLIILGMYQALFSRISKYYMVYLTILIPNILHIYRKRNMHWIFGLLVSALLLLFMVYSLRTSIIVPYRFFFS